MPSYRNICSRPLGKPLNHFKERLEERVLSAYSRVVVGEKQLDF